MSRALLALALLALLAPLASAHVGPPDQSAALAVGDRWGATLQLRPTVPFVNETVSVTVLVNDRSSGMYAPDVAASILVGGPAGYTVRKELVPDGTGYRVGAITPPAKGIYSLRLLLRDPETNETASADTEIEVYPNLPFRIQPVDASQDTFVGRLTRLAFEVVDPITLARKDAFDDLEVQVEHWTDDHKTMLASHAAAPEKISTGTWRIDETFPEVGMYHIRFRSLAADFNYSDVPLLHVNAIPPPPEEKAKAPAPSALLVAAAVVGAALLLRKR